MIQTRVKIHLNTKTERQHNIDKMVQAKSQKGDFAAVREDIKKLLNQPEYDDGSAGPVLVRLAW